ncbi:DNA polymerase III subunit delta [Methylovulum miyakonense]|uniref:DNA polymerase III subunit delta n=1 Tax=Methylovulum miyakonense TaxID=645578 RepID=UPI00035F8B1C|nr:DNA polymerase III subunit delta [Methylovulum miyakonense]
MQLKTEQLKPALQKSLAPVYFISGDEPLQIGEAADTIRTAARQAGFTSREIFSVDTGFAWNQLGMAADSMSIFADKQIIELRLSSSTPGIEGAKALTAYCGRPPETSLLLVTAGKLSKESLKSKWFQALDKAGVTIQVRALEGQDLLRWLQQRLSSRGLQTGQAGLRLLASRVEGNLLAAAQEIEKLYVLYGDGALDTQQIETAVADSSRYDVFKLMDSILAGKPNRILKILSGLHAEGVAPPVILWAIMREARTLVKIKWAVVQGQGLETAFKNHQIWDKRKPLVSEALQRLSDSDLDKVLVLSAKADRQSKGQQAGDVWETLRVLCLVFASVPVMAPIG